jgi:glucan phosphoethanolaminetransferase (alkaline phosphatase superfamily)
MIQRVQTIFLFLVGVCMAICLATVSWEKTGSQSGEKAMLNAFSLEHQKAGAVVSSTPTFYIAILALVAAAIAVYSIFQYRNRLQQIKLGALNSLLMAALSGIILYFSKHAETLFDASRNGNYKIGIFAVIAGLVFNMIANRLIRRDEQLVRSADRMR